MSRSRPVLKYLCSRQASLRCTYSSAAAVPTQSSVQPVEIPPESPKYIYIPQPPQRQAKYSPSQKGVLPKPRKIFDSKRVNKASDKYLAAVAPEPTTQRLTEHLPSEQKDYIDYKSRQSSLRRQNLKEGLTSLRDRKTRIDSKVAAISARKQSDYQRRVAAPEREDDRLTRPSVLDALRPGKLSIQPDPNLPAILGKKKQNNEAVMKAKKDERKYAFHTLYMNAKDFIVTENDLDKKIREEFDKEFYKKNPGRGIWDEQGIPETTKWMTSEEMIGASVIERNKAQMETSRDRVQRIAEELTGGKM